MKKVKPETVKFYDLFPMLKSLEKQRPGIKDRVWKFLCDEDPDIAFAPINGRIGHMNLYYYGIGPEYFPDDVESIEHSKSIHPEAFAEGKIKELRLDFNLIAKVYLKDVEGLNWENDLEMFHYKPNW